LQQVAASEGPVRHWARIVLLCVARIVP
jgi:hypothetical protein